MALGLVNVFSVTSVFCEQEASSSATHPKIHGCLVVFRFRVIITVRFFGGEMALLVLWCCSLGSFRLTLFPNVVLRF